MTDETTPPFGDLQVAAPKFSFPDWLCAFYAARGKFLSMTTTDPIAILATNLGKLKAHAKQIEWRSETGIPLWTATGLEEVSGVSDSALSRFFRRGRAMDVEQIAAVARAYGLQAWELLFPEFEADAPPSAQLETLYQLVEARLREDELRLSSLRGVNARRSKKGHQGTGEPTHEVPAGDPTPKHD